MTTWKPCIERMREASATPIEESAKASTKTSGSSSTTLSTRQLDADNRRQHQQHKTLDHRLGRAAERLADGDRRAVDRRHQDLLEEAELTIPDDAHRPEDGREEDRHPDDSREDELRVGEPAGAPALRRSRRRLPAAPS